MLRPLDQWLLWLCDPRGPPSELPPCDLQEADLARLFRHADRHGVLPALVGNLRRHSPHAGQIIEGNGAVTCDAELGGVSMFLRVAADGTPRCVRAKGVPAVLIKGPLAAKRLYCPVSLRTYIDIDVLVSRSAWEDARAVMPALGYRPKNISMKYDAGYGEEEWMHAVHAGCSFRNCTGIW